MSKEDSFIRDLIRGTQSQASITAYIRSAFISDKRKIESLADNLHKMPGYEKNHHGKLRIMLARISDELGIERHSIRKVNGHYKVVFANRRSTPQETITLDILRSAEKANNLSSEAKLDILLRIKALWKM